MYSVNPYLKNDANSSHKDGYSEDPKEESVHDHGHIFPILDNLKNGTEVQTGFLLYCRRAF
jgi:hypothetical protein